MIMRIILLILALLLLTACEGTRLDAQSAYQPCEQMKTDAALVDTLQDQVNNLQSRTYPADKDTVVDSAAQVATESLLVQKENLLTLSVQSMQSNAEACRAQSQPFDRYRTESEQEEGL